MNLTNWDSCITPCMKQATEFNKRYALGMLRYYEEQQEFLTEQRNGYYGTYPGRETKVGTRKVSLIKRIYEP
uniref:Transposase n=1 Tax=Heterorhabditis bacteriophora TaxID=37862 RepID=A0A1I7WSY4_HETBA